MIFNYILLVPDSHHRRFSVSLGYNLLSSSTSLNISYTFLLYEFYHRFVKGLSPFLQAKFLLLKVSMDQSIVSQREINVDTESYVTALRASLRQSPDVILLGEMRDYETMQVAMTAAETGHLIFSTLHTIGAASTIDRIIDVFPPNQQHQIAVQLSMVLQAVISQQLVPSIDEKMIPVF